MSDDVPSMAWVLKARACKELRALGFTTLQSAQVYAFIATESQMERPPLSIVQIAKECALPFSTVSRIVGELLDDKRVTLEFDDADRRKKFVRLAAPKKSKASKSKKEG